jgi:hypothetical protein
MDLPLIRFWTPECYEQSSQFQCVVVQYGLVRVKVVLRDSEEYDGWKFNQRPPRVGDIGTITDILHARGVPDHFVVEMSEPDTGKTIWLSEFEKEELEPLKRPV